MTTASVILKKLLKEDYSAVQDPFGSRYVPNPNDAKAFSSQNRSLDIPDQTPLAERIGNIIDSLSDSDITEDLADVVEGYLEQVDPSGDMTVEEAAAMLPLPDCQGLLQALTSYLDKQGIQYSDSANSDANSVLPTQIPADLYPSSSGMIMGGNPVAPAGGFNIGV